MSDNSYGKDSLIDDAIENIDNEQGTLDDSQNDNSLGDDFGFDPFKDEGDMSSEDVLNEIESSSENEEGEHDGSQNDKIDESFDAELLGMLEDADTSVTEDNDDDLSDSDQTVGFNDEPLPDDAEPIDDLVDAVADNEDLDDDKSLIDSIVEDALVEGSDSDEMRAEDVGHDEASDGHADEVSNDNEADSDHSEDILDDDLFAGDEPVVSGEIGDEDDVSNDFIDDKSVDEELIDDSSFFDDVLEASDENVETKESHQPNDKDELDDPDYVLPDDGFDDISSDEEDAHVGDILDDIPEDPTLDELSLTGELESNVQNESNNDMSDALLGKGVGMMSDDNVMKEEVSTNTEIKEAKAETPSLDDENTKQVESADDDESSEKLEKSDKLEKVRGASFNVPWKKIGLVSACVGFLAAAGWGGFNFINDYQPSVSAEPDSEYSVIMSKFEALQKSVDDSLNEVAQKAGEVSNEKYEVQLEQAQMQLNQTAQELREAINALSDKTDADKAEMQAMNEKALLLMDKFVDDTRQAQSQVAEQVYARVISSVENNPGNNVDPRYIQSIADTQAELKATTASLGRRVQTQMNIINVLESENQFLNKRLLSVEAENDSLKRKKQGLAKQQSGSDVYVEVRSKDGIGVGGYYPSNQQEPDVDKPLYVLKGVFENIDGGNEAVIYIAPYDAPNSRPVDYRVGESIPGMGEILSIEKLKGKHTVPYTVKTSSGVITGTK